MTDETKITAYKAFNPDWTCRGFQYAIGQTYTHDGKIDVCEVGFHACENPLEVFQYYAPTGKFASVEMSGSVSKSKDGDTRLASAQITVKVEISLHDFIGRAVAWLTANAKENVQHATGDRSAASATGDRSCAMGAGYQNKAMGIDGCAVFLVERDNNYNIVNARAGIIGRDLKANVWYMLRGGEFVEAD